MTEELQRYVKEHWTEVGTPEEKEIAKSMSPELRKQYNELIDRLMMEEKLAIELGVCW